jgi:transcription initiation factor TFIIB
VLSESPLELEASLATSPPRRRGVHEKSKYSKRSAKVSPLKRALTDLLFTIESNDSLQKLAIEICDFVDERGLARGYADSTLSKTIVYTACRLNGTPILPSDLALTTAVDRRRIIRCHNRLSRKLELQVPRIECVAYMAYLAKKKKVRRDVLTIAENILRSAKEKRIMKGANPIGISAATLYLAGIAGGQRLSQNELAKMAGVSEVTIRADCKILQKLLLKESQPNT